MIVVVVPVLGRPHRVLPLIDSFLAARGAETTLLFVCSPDDDATVREIDAFMRDDPTGLVDVCSIADAPGHGDFAKKVNHAYRVTLDPFLFQAADDVEFVPGWDVAVLAVADGCDAGVIGTNDDANPKVKRGSHSTHSLIRRSYIDECGGSLEGPGVVFSEEYGHQWVDNELVELAQARGCFAFAAGSIVRHSHPVWRTAPEDDTYRKGAATARADAALFKERRRAWKR